MRPIVVLGGGAAGIAAACALADRGKRVLLLESTPRLGGRAASFRDRETGDEVDYGHHVLMRCCTEIRSLLSRLGQVDAVRFQHRLRVPLAGPDRCAVLRSRPLPGPLHLLPGLLSYRHLARRERAAALRAGIALLGPRPAGEPTFGAWLRSRGQTRRCLDVLWNPICVATLNAGADAVSASAAFTVFQRGFLTAHGADLGLFTRPLSRVFAAVEPFLRARGGEVRCRTAAARILCEGDEATGIVVATGETLAASAVVAALTPRDLLPLLPEPIRAAPPFSDLDAIRWSPIVNLHLWFDRSILTEPFLLAVDSPIQAVFDVTRLHGRAGATHVVVSQSAATDWIDRPTVEIAERLRSALARLLPAVTDARLLRQRVIKSRQATILCAPGSAALRPAPRTPVRGLVLAGDWTATGWPSTLEGAVRSGHASVAALLESDPQRQP